MQYLHVYSLKKYKIEALNIINIKLSNIKDVHMYILTVLRIYRW